MNKKIILSLIILISFSFVISAQSVSPVIMAQINSELKSRGLTETEVRTRLLSEGIDLENIPPDELPQYQTRVTAILDKMEAEKKGTTNAAAAEVTTGPIVAKPIVIEPAKEIITQPETTKEEAVAEAAQRVITADVKKEGPAKIYGHSLFKDQSLDVFRTTDGALAPETYILGAGDEIRISIFGASQTDMQFLINNEGYIQPTGMPKIFLQGLSLLQARALLYKRLSVSYTFRSDQFALTIATARTIMVNIFGETKITGGFTISALNSALNALTAAGGPTDIGSVRNIQLIRGNKRSAIDLYAFMNDPAIQSKFDLQQNDIIYVPVAQNLISITGAVKRAMRYELLPTENLKDLIRYAGGLNVDVYPDFVQIQRYIDGEIRLQEFNLADVLKNKINVALHNGDIVRIKSIEKPIEQFVEISGSVYYPGNYDIQSNFTLSSLLANAKPTTQAKTDLIFIERIRPDETVEVLTIAWEDFQDSGKDFRLMARDRIRVPQLASYRDVETISVKGYVRSPFEKSFSLTDKLTLKQAIEIADGFKADVNPIAYVLRKNLSNPEEKDYIRIELEKNDDFLLQAGDALTIYDKKTFTDQATIAVSGNVRIPFEQTFSVNDNLTVKKAIELAGGLKATAYPIAYIFRSDLFNPEKTEYIRINLEEAGNFVLKPGDRLNIYDNSLFTNIGEVRVFGAVNSPREFTFDPSLSVKDVITAAGGFDIGAAQNRVEVFRTILSPTEKTRLEMITLELDSNYQLINPTIFNLQPYDQIVVRMTPEFTLGRLVQITGQVKYPGTYVLESKEVHLSELIKNAGGCLDEADSRGSRLFRTYNNRGSITMDIKKAVRNEGNAKFDPILFEGDVINIERKENTVEIRPNATRLAESTLAETGETLNVVFQGNRSARWYIKNYAGGFAERADKNSVTVILKNGQVKSTKNPLWVFRNSPNVEPGSMISLQMKPPKVEKESTREKTSWGEVFGTTLSAVTTALTVLVLAKQL
ncbi:MAG: SLBB domain-containing protein [Bacteroidales bacterium]|jgi:protein involved in polysaccharide export with SLBB domain|nr:SLBB domain-containing protein [Bacteroidales bacterium]